MRGFTGFFGSVSMAALILMGSMARGDEVRPAESAAATSASSKASEVAANLRQQFMAMYVDVLYDAPKPCVDDCEVPIKLTWTNVDNKDYCLASVPKELTFESSNFKKKQRITWKLDHTDLDSKGRKIEFDENHGIFFIPDGKNQIDAPKRTSQDTFEVTNVHSKVTKVTYLPVILWWTNDPEPQPELCAAGDPIINNK